MANFVDCQLVTDSLGRHCIVAVTNRPDGGHGCFYTLHQPRGGIVGSGDSSSVGASAAADSASAMKNGKAAAKRWLANMSRVMESVQVPLPNASVPGAPGAQHKAAAGAPSLTSIETRTQPQRKSPLPLLQQCPRDEIAFMFNSTCVDLPSIKPWTQWSEQRTQALNHIWSFHPDLAFWRTLFNRVHASDFLCARLPSGPDKKPWAATFDWILHPDKLPNILDGMYDNRAQGSRSRRKTPIQEQSPTQPNLRVSDGPQHRAEPSSESQVT